MDQVIDRPGIQTWTETCAKWTLGSVARTGALMMGAALASVLMIDLPIPAGRAAADGQGAAQPYAPASDKWIELGTPRLSEASPRSDLLHKAAAVDPAAIAVPARNTERQRSRRKPRGVRLASLGREVPGFAGRGADLAAERLRWVASSGCLSPPLRGVLAEVAASFGPVAVNSTCRSDARKARVGGSPRSRHRTGAAADFRVGGNPRAVHAFLSSHRSVGGLKHYGNGRFHIDTGPRRTW